MAAGNETGGKRDCLTEDKGNERLCPERHHEVKQKYTSEQYYVKVRDAFHPISTSEYVSTCNHISPCFP